jgi:Ni/Co efflux regulator RcnB
MFGKPLLETQMIPSTHSRCLLAMAFALLAAAGPATAAKPEAQPAQPAAEQPAAAPPGKAVYGVKFGGFFNEQHKKAARTAFAQRYARAKDCPEGMERTAKKCAPPVEGRYWVVGQALQPAVKSYPVPDAIKAKLPPPPEGYEYVMAGEDILLVSKALHLVVDMIEDVAG